VEANGTDTSTRVMVDTMTDATQDVTDETGAEEMDEMEPDGTEPDKTEPDGAEPDETEPDGPSWLTAPGAPLEISRGATVTVVGSPVTDVVTAVMPMQEHAAARREGSSVVEAVML
jgi:hypothetical protein